MSGTISSNQGFFWNDTVTPDSATDLESVFLDITNSGTVALAAATAAEAASAAASTAAATAATVASNAVTTINNTATSAVTTINNTVTSATTALNTAASGAATSATNAASSASSASTSATSAAGSATAAGTSETNAATSASAASGSASAASTSATNAATSASSASTSAAAASTAATTAVNTKFLVGTGRDISFSDQTTHADISVANSNPLFIRSPFELASTVSPVNKTEFTLLGFSGNTVALSGSQTYGLLGGSVVLSGTTTADTLVNKFTVQGNMASSAPNGVFGLTSSVVMANGSSGAWTGIQGLATANGTGVTGANLVGVEGNTNATVNVGGVSGTTSGNAYGAYFQATLGASAATFWTNLVGMEVDVSAVSGSSVNTKTGVSVVALPSDAVAGFKARDSAFAIGQGTAAALGWDYAIRINGVGGGFPIKTSGTLLGVPVESGVVNGGTIFNGIDLTNLTITGKAWKSTGCTLDGSGNLVTASVKSTGGIGAFGSTPPASKPTITGSRGSATATVLASLLTALAAAGLITDSTTA